MIVKRIFKTYIDVSDPKDIYSSDRDVMLVAKLTEKFVGVCYHSCYVLKINKIIRRAYMYMKDTLDGDANTNVMFEADVIVYTPGEVINGCTIIKKEPNGIVHAKSKYAGIQINMQSMSIFKEGDVVPVVVKRVRYNVHQSAITVSANPFVPNKYAHIYYKLTGNISASQAKELKMHVADVQNLLQYFSKLKATDAKIYKFFVDLMFNKKEKNKIPPKATKVDLFKLIDTFDEKNDNGTSVNGVVYKASMPYNDTSVYYNDDASILEKLESKSTIIEQSRYLVFTDLVLSQLSKLQTIKDFVEFYPDFKSVQQNKEIWKMYTMLKS
jgi:hypothetical protein